MYVLTVIGLVDFIDRGIFTKNCDDEVKTLKLRELVSFKAEMSDSVLQNRPWPIRQT